MPVTPLSHSTAEPHAIDQSVMVTDDEPSRFMPMSGKTHSCQVAEPEEMDVDTKDAKNMGGDKGLVCHLQYPSIDEETQAADLTEEIDVRSMEPVDLGGYSDIYMGFWIPRVSVDKRLRREERVGAVGNCIH